MVNVVIFDKDDTGNTKVSQTKFNEKGNWKNGRLVL